MSVAVTSSEALEGFCTLAKSSSGTQLVMVIRQVLKQPSIFVFGELLDSKNVQDVSSISHTWWCHRVTRRHRPHPDCSRALCWV
jgi:hypothetical protein